MRTMQAATSGIRTASTGSRRPSRPGGSTWLLAVLVALTACGQGATAGTSTNATADAARNYARCMRDNGVPDFPDPDANGQLRGAGHEKQNDPKFLGASEKCRSSLPGGGN